MPNILESSFDYSFIFFLFKKRTFVLYKFIPLSTIVLTLKQLFELEFIYVQLHICPSLTLPIPYPSFFLPYTYLYLVLAIFNSCSQKTHFHLLVDWSNNQVDLELLQWSLHPPFSSPSSPYFHFHNLSKLFTMTSSRYYSSCCWRILTNSLKDSIFTRIETWC